MIEHLVCECGHEWELPVDADAETTEVSLRCPECAGPARRKNPVPLFANSQPATLPHVHGVVEEAPRGHAADKNSRRMPRPTVPGFEIIRELGRGGMGVVYLARHQQLGRLVALKMVLAGSHIGDKERTRFQAEAAAVARLQHPNIVQIFEVGDSEGRPFLCLEYVAGGSLAEHLDGTPVPPREAAEFMATIARAVHAAHQQDLVHRDLKPGNILLRDGEFSAGSSGETPVTRIPLTAFQAKITDFGLAKDLEDASSQTQSGTVLGTPSYMAPEQANGHSRQIGRATDVYALGAILYELLTGRPPFRGETPLDTVMQVMGTEVVRPSVLQPKCARDLETICLKCLEKDARKRYASAQELSDDLLRFLNFEPIQARPIGAIGRTARWARRHPGVAALLAITGTGMALGFIIVLALWRRAESDRAAALDGRQQAAQQEARARANLAKAIEAVDRMLTRVADERLAYVPQFEDERRQILEEAVAFYHDFLEQEESDPALRREMGRAYFRLGRVFMGLGKHERARESFHHAQQFQERLTQQFPQESTHVSDLALTLCSLGDAHRLVGKVEEADPLYVRALELAESVARANPHAASYQQVLAEVLQQRGRHFFQSRRLEEAENCFERGIDELRHVLRNNAQDFKLRLQHADMLAFLGYFQHSLRKYTVAEAHLQQAIGELEALIREFPAQKRECEPKLANARMYLAFVLAATNRSSEADSLLRQGVTTFEQLVREYPKSPNYRFVLARGQHAIASRLRQGEKPEQAEQALKNAIITLEQLDRENPEAFYQGLTLRQCYRELGQTYLVQKQPELAITEIRKAIAHAVEDQPALPKNSPLQFEIDSHRLALAQAFTARGQHDDALNQLEQAIAHNLTLSRKLPGADAQLQVLRMHKAAALAAAGQHALAVREAESASAANVKDHTAQYNLACVYSLCATAVRADMKLPTLDRQRTGNDYEERAIELLKQLRSSGYFRSPVFFRQLLQDRDLEALRSRADFRKFMSEFPSKPKPAPGT